MFAKISVVSRNLARSSGVLSVEGVRNFLRLRACYLLRQASMNLVIGLPGSYITRACKRAINLIRQYCGYIQSTLRLLGHAAGQLCRMHYRSASNKLNTLCFTGRGTYGLLDPENGRINGHLTLLFDLCLFFFTEFFEFAADREKQDERLDRLRNEGK